jgi:cytochrome c oxidase subunit III
MTASINLEAPQNKKISSKLFLLYISFGSMFMFFSSLCSAIVVKRGDFKHWQEVVLPSSFLTSTIIIIISSVTIQIAYKSIADRSKFIIYGLLTYVLAILFVYFQLNGWGQLKSAGVLFTGNPSGTFIYVVSLFHGVHYIGGIFFLTLLMFMYRKGNLTEGRKENFNVLAQYWHYIGLVWVILYVFFKFLIYN